VAKVAFSPIFKDMLVTCSLEGEIFFFEVSGNADLNRYDPLCMVRLPEETKVTDLKWDFESKFIVVATESGRIYQIKKPEREQVDNKATYEIENYPMQVWKIKMMHEQMKKNQAKDAEEEEKKKRLRLRGLLQEDDEEEEEDWDPEAITAFTYLPDMPNKFIIASKGLFGGFFYLCDFNEERPL
jgi:hypothetical protein